jgi:hypothetical protein
VDLGEHFEQFELTLLGLGDELRRVHSVGQDFDLAHSCWLCVWRTFGGFASRRNTGE